MLGSHILLGLNAEDRAYFFSLIACLALICTRISPKAMPLEKKESISAITDEVEIFPSSPCLSSVPCSHDTVLAYLQSSG